MATGSSTDDGTTALERLSSPRMLGRDLLEALVFDPGRSAAIGVVVVAYLWLLGYVAGTALGVRGDPVVANDWLTLIFTSYALLSALALGQRILAVGIAGSTEGYLVDAVALTWLTAFYFVWMMARDPVSASTSLFELYGPVLESDPGALLWTTAVGVAAVVTVGLVYRADEADGPFESEFRTALVTMPVLVTATVLVVQPGPNSPVWPVVGGVFLGTVAVGLCYVQSILTWAARGGFAVVSLVAWSIGALGWMVAYRSRPPTDRIVLERVTVDESFGGEATGGDSTGCDRTGGPAADEATPDDRSAGDE